MSLPVLLAAIALGIPTSSSQDQTTLPDVSVIGRPTAEVVREFVGRIAAPAQGRGLAQWTTRICPGVANLSTDAAQAILDRISSVAEDLDIETGEPGCDPNIIILFTDDGAGAARAMVGNDPDVFSQNVSGLDRGPAALREFQSGDAPVRWWSLSLPVNIETGQRAVRVPGDGASITIAGDDDSPLTYAPIIQVTGASRLRTQIVDVLYKTIVIVDVDQIGAVDTNQLGDYLAFVSLAQIDGGANTTGFDTILNLFDGEGPSGLTDWDRAYLQALYAPRGQRVSAGAQATAVASIMTGDRRAAARRE